MTNAQFLRSLAVLLVLAALFALIGTHTDLDLRLADWMYDPAAKAFPWRDTWFAEWFMHSFAKVALIGLGLVPFVLLIADLALGRTLLRPPVRRRLLVVAAAAVVVPSVISGLKAVSIYHCPWSLERYGGIEPYLRLFEALPTGVQPGHCFPAGHASSGLWLAALAVFWWPRRPATALTVFIAGLLPGLALGWVQQLRGAHFLTHTLWSAWIAAAVILVLVRLMLPASEAEAETASTSASEGEAATAAGPEAKRNEQEREVQPN